MLAVLKRTRRVANAGHALARRSVHRWAGIEAKRLCRNGRSHLAAALLSVVNVLPEERFGGTLVGGYVDAIHSAVLEAQLDALDTRMLGDDARANTFIAVGELLRQCAFIPWWAWWLRAAAQRRLSAYCSGLEEGPQNVVAEDDVAVVERCASYRINYGADICAQGKMQRFWESRPFEVTYGEVAMPAALYWNPAAEIDQRSKLPLWRLIVTATEIVVHCRLFALTTKEEVYAFLRVLSHAAERASELQSLSSTRASAPPAAARKYAGSIVSGPSGVHFLRNRMTLRPPSEAEALIPIVRERWWDSGAYRTAYVSKERS